MSRTAVFDPDALNDELDDLLPPPTPTPKPEAVTSPAQQDAPPSPPESTSPPAPDPDTTAPASPTPAPAARRPEGERRQPRGSGGRPAAEAPPAAPPAPNALIVVAARIPTALWQQVSDTLLSGRERPSYAQVIAWTCQDHPDEVLDRIRDNSQPDRAPRGRRVATPVNTITVRFRPDELATFDALLAEAGGEGPAPTRTSGVIAAFQVAVTHAPAQ